MSCGENDSPVHTHTWVPDGESWAETDHHESCNYPEADSVGEIVQTIESCECESYRVRRYTCHCGKMKEVKYKD